jgi:hypothetical protein
MSAISADIVWRPTEGAMDPESPKDVSIASLSSRINGTHEKSNSQVSDSKVSEIRQQRSELYKRYKEVQSKRSPANVAATNFSRRSPFPSGTGTESSLQRAQSHKRVETGDAHFSNIDADMPSSKSAPLHLLSSAHLVGEDVELSKQPGPASNREVQITPLHSEAVSHRTMLT